jgi:anthranilate phosphoribosyltransferase
LTSALQRISTGSQLPPGLVARAFGELTEIDTASVRDSCLAALFTGLMARGPVEREVLEVFEAALSLDRDKAAELSFDGGRVVLVAGSGKKGRPFPNVSTPSAIVAAAAGCPVVKVGSHSTSSTLGSRDLSRRLGLAESRTAADVVSSLGRDGYAFVPIEDSIPSIDRVYGGRFHVVNPFSFGLGPLAVPFRADVVVYGLAHPRVDLAARVLGQFGIREAVVVTSRTSAGRYVDELGAGRDSVLCRMQDRTVGPALTHRAGDLPGASSWEAPTIAPSTEDDAVEMAIDVIGGRGSRPYTELVALNTGVFLSASGVVPGLDAGYELALATIEGGRAHEQLERLRRAGSCVPA